MNCGLLREQYVHLHIPISLVLVLHYVSIIHRSDRNIQIYEMDSAAFSSKLFLFLFCWFTSTRASAGIPVRFSELPSFLSDSIYVQNTESGFGFGFGVGGGFPGRGVLGWCAIVRAIFQPRGRLAGAGVSWL